MRHYWSRLLLGLGLCLLAAGLHAEEQERIEDFAVTLRLDTQGMLQVSERITVYATGQQIRRGIYRDLPVRYRLPGGLWRQTPIEQFSASRDGRPESVHRERQGSYERFYLGSPYELLKPGRYTYQLNYRVDAQLIAHAERDELYWNVTGNDWQFPILRASLFLQLPDGAQIAQVAAYTGSRGEQGESFAVLQQGNNSLRLRTSAPLAVQQGLTVAVDWPRGVVVRPDLAQRSLRLLFDNPGSSLGLLLLLVSLGYYLHQWRRVGRDPQAGLVIPRFQGPHGLLPAEVGYLWRRGRQSEAEALSLSFTDWAIRGLLLLKDRPRAEGFVLQPGKLDSAEQQPAEQALLRELFPQGRQSTALTLGTRYEKRLAALQDALQEHLQSRAKAWYARNRRDWAYGLLLALPGMLLSVVLSVEPGDELGMAIAGMLFSVGFGLPGALVVRVGLSDNQWSGRLMLLFFGGMFVLAACLGLAFLLSATSLPVWLLLAGYLALLIGFYFWLEAPSALGQQLLDELAGYREYLSLAESDSLARAGDAPAMSIALYEQHLPYAMALGVEARWTARFSQAIATGLIEPGEQGYQPRWYDSRRPISSPAALTASLGSSLALASSSASTPPASSSSSSGSSGGGSSGGGSGGGGGGGW